MDGFVSGSVGTWSVGLVGGAFRLDAVVGGRRDEQFFVVVSSLFPSTAGDVGHALVLRAIHLARFMLAVLVSGISQGMIMHPVAAVAYLVILEPGIGQFREFESPRVHTRINSWGLFPAHKLTCGKRESVS